MFLNSTGKMKTILNRQTPDELLSKFGVLSVLKCHAELVSASLDALKYPESPETRSGSGQGDIK